MDVFIFTALVNRNFCKQTVQTLIRCRMLGLHCLHNTPNRYLVLKGLICVITVSKEKGHPKHADGTANSADPDQTAYEQSDLGLHCQLSIIC